MGRFTPSGNQTPEHSSLKAGVYPCEVVGAKAKISKDGAFEQHSLRVRVYDEKNDDWEDFWDLLSFSERAQLNLEEAMKTLGIAFQIGVAVSVDAEDWIGKTGTVLLKEDYEDGQKRLRLNKWLPREQIATGSPTLLARANRSSKAEGLSF
jgi:hypothetical protein